MLQLDKKYVGEMIREVREQRGLQQKDLAEKLGINSSTMSKIENGQQDIDVQKLVNISEALNVRLEYLLGMDRDIDDERHMMNLFIKKIITTQRFFGNKRVFASKDFEDFFCSVKGQYVVLVERKAIFSLIKKIAIANGQGKVARKTLIDEALRDYSEEKDNEAVGNYFLIAQDEMKNIVREYIKWEKAREDIEDMYKYRDT